MKTLTRRQEEILDFIIYYWKAMSASPTYQDISDDFDIGNQAVQNHVEALREKGYLEPKTRGTARNFIPAGLRKHINKFRKSQTPVPLSCFRGL